MSSQFPENVDKASRTFRLPPEVLVANTCAGPQFRVTVHVEVDKPFLYQFESISITGVSLAMICAKTGLWGVSGTNGLIPAMVVSQ